MARKNVLKPVKVSTAQSMAASFNSPATVIEQGDNVGYQINITTSNSTGTFAIQVSDDYQEANPNSGPAITGNWSALTLSGTPSAAGATDTINISLNQVPHRAIRVAYTSTVAGTGVCDIFVTYKAVGA